MKKLLKLAAVFAALALMFGFAACSDSDDDDDEPTSPPPASALYTVYQPDGSTIMKGEDNAELKDLSKEQLDALATKYSLAETTDYTIEGNKVTLTEAGYAKVTGGEPEPQPPVQKVLAVAYDLENGLPSSITATEQLVNASWAAPTADPAENDVTFTWIATTNRKVKSNSGLQFSNGTAPDEAIKLTAESAITVKVTYKFAGAYAADKVREIDVGDKVVKMEATTDKDTTYNVTCTAAKEVSIKANGMKILKIETAPAQ